MASGGEKIALPALRDKGILAFYGDSHESILGHAEKETSRGGNPLGTVTDASMQIRFLGTLRVKPEKVQEFTAWQADYIKALSRLVDFENLEVVSPQDADNTWSLKLTFASQEGLELWLGSEERKGLMEKARGLCLGPMRSECLPVHEKPLGVSEVIHSCLKPGATEEYQQWQAEMNLHQSRFTGYLGTIFQPPLANQKHWTTILRFDTVGNLEEWLGSDTRKRLLKKQEHLVEELRQYRVGTSFPGWVPAPPADHQAPPSWKTTLLVILGLFPVVELQSRFVDPFLAGLPGAVPLFVALTLSASLISYVTMPLCIRLFSWWLYPSEPEPLGQTLKGVALITALYLLEIALFSQMAS